ncbi:unnamed protein product, partial [Musa acuminata subsp. burmannicoides]
EPCPQLPIQHLIILLQIRVSLETIAKLKKMGPKRDSIHKLMFYALPSKVL